MLRKDLRGVYGAVISHARADNVERMQALVGEMTWFVGEGEGVAYRKAGASDVVEGGTLCRSRNLALKMAGTLAVPCVQLSDDLTKVQVAVRGAKKVEARDASFVEVMGRVLDGMTHTGAMLGGAAPTSNPFYANVDKPVHQGAFIVGDFIVVGAGCPLRFEEAMTLKEDYDYTLQHLMTYGTVARRDDVLMTFLHRKNAGGAVAVRTPELEQANIAFLKAKWPHFIADNPRRPNEILLKMKRRR